MRDILKNKQYFEDFIKKNKEVYNKRLIKFEDGLIKPEREIIVKLSMLSSLIRCIKAKYSIGSPTGDLLNDYYEALELIAKYWTGNNKFVNNNNEIIDHYSLGNYDIILWMLSIGYLLEIPKEKFKILVNVINNDNVKDSLYEFIISARLPSRSLVNNESYKSSFTLYSKLKAAIKITDKLEAANLIKSFLEKDWYKEHINSGWYNSHNNKHNTYSGYWSFESAAIVKIMGLDDSSFVDHQYYPKDLVHQTSEPIKKKGLLGRLGF